MGDATRDAPSGAGEGPRDIITPDAFRVAPALLGHPLAGPGRRGVAMLVDLALIGVLLLVKQILGALFLVAAGGLLVWAARRPERREGIWDRVVRLVTRTVAVVLALVGGVRMAMSIGEPPEATVADELSSSVAREVTSATAGLDALDEGGRAALREVPGLMQDVVALEEASDSAAAARLADRVARRLARLGSERSDIRDALDEALDREPRRTWEDAVVAGALASLDSIARGRTARADSLARRWTAALAAGDSARADSLRSELAAALTGGSLARLRDENERLEDELEAARETRGPVDLLREAANDLGMGLGWTGLYFTVFLAFWRGQTPGKRLLGLRVWRLTGEPLGWWDAFGRFGGYAAGLATGLIGFLQILWDPNRQGIHDRIAGTVVVRERA